MATINPEEAADRAALPDAVIANAGGSSGLMTRTPVTRWREALAHGQDNDTAIRTAMGTAGAAALALLARDRGRSDHPSRRG